MKVKKGFTLVEILIVIGIVGLILTIVVIALNGKQEQIRDAKRISDINALHDALEVVKNQVGTYDRAYCDLTFVSLCAKNDNSELVKILPSLSSMNDPKVLNTACDNYEVCQKKGCNYTFSKLDPNEYEVIFSLEKGIKGYSQKGCYRLISAGIEKL